MIHHESTFCDSDNDEAVRFVIAAVVRTVVMASLLCTWAVIYWLRRFMQ
jgi:hypothetical protein